MDLEATFRQIASLIEVETPEQIERARALQTANPDRYLVSNIAPNAFPPIPGERTFLYMMVAKGAGQIADWVLDGEGEQPA